MRDSEWRRGINRKWYGFTCNLVVYDTSQGAYRWLEGPPVCVPSVVALLQQVLAPPVVGMLVEDPDALLDLS